MMIFYSRDVQFNELECGVEKESSDPDKRRYVELELPSDDETLSDTPVQPAPHRSWGKEGSPCTMENGLISQTTKNHRPFVKLLIVQTKYTGRMK